MRGLPARGGAVRELGLPPAGRPPLLEGWRPLKRWRYVGVYGPELMLCAGVARIGPLPQHWWAVALPDGTLRERTTVARGGVRLPDGAVRIDAPGLHVELSVGDSGEAVDVASPSGASWIWTRKRAALPARGVVELDGRRHEVEALTVVDDSAGYHERRTTWKWSAGVGRARTGERVGWNLVSGIHDAGVASERSVWLEGSAREVGPVRFADDLSRVVGTEGETLCFEEWSAREDHTNLLVMRSDYRQPFGTFSGRLPGGVDLAEGYGVMEEHDVRW